MNLPTTALDRRVPLAVALLGMVLTCLGSASLAGPAPLSPIAAAHR